MNRPIYGMTTNPSEEVSRQIRAARILGFDFFEIGLEPPMGDHQLLSRKKSVLLGELKKFSHPPVAHTPYWYDLWSSYEEIRNAWIKVVKDTMEVAKVLGCEKFNIHSPIPHAGYESGKGPWDESLDLFVKSMKEITRHAKSMNMRVMLENMGPYGATFPEYKKILENVPGLFAHLDIGHAFLEGGMAMVRKYLKTFKVKIEHFHFTDNLGISDDHLPIGHGIIDYIKVMEILSKMKYSKTISLEIISSKKDTKESLDIVRAIEEEVWGK